MTVHPTAIVSPGVELGTGVTVGPHACLLGPCVIGDGAWIGPGCVIGTPPEIRGAEQNRAWDGELAHHGVEIGAGAVLRELSTVQQGSRRTTRIGVGSWLLARAYVAHDGLVGDGVTLSAGVVLAGHAQVGDGTTVGMNAAVHQRRVIGPGCMIGMTATVTRDVPPFAKAYGTPARVHGANVVLLTRNGVAPETATALDAAYRAGAEPTTDDPALSAAWTWWEERHNRA